MLTTTDPWPKKGHFGYGVVLFPQNGTFDMQTGMVTEPGKNLDVSVVDCGLDVPEPLKGSLDWRLACNWIGHLCPVNCFSAKE